MHAKVCTLEDLRMRADVTAKEDIKYRETKIPQGTVGTAEEGEHCIICNFPNIGKAFLPKDYVSKLLTSFATAS